MIVKPLKEDMMQYKAQKLLALAMTIISCNNAVNHPASSSESGSGATTPAIHYNLSAPVQKWSLPKELKEISGNAWVDDKHLLVIEDLHPNLYLLRLDNSAVVERTVAFAPERDKKFDIEDVTLVGNTAYALWSHGVIYRVNDWMNKPETSEINTSLSKENNTEGICYDPVTGNLLIACKNEADADEKKSTRAIYAYDLKKNQFIDQPFLLIHKKDFKEVEGEKLDFYPSAIAVHPITHDIFILSTRGTKCLAEFTHEGSLKAVRLIDPAEMLQPEGICFAPDGTMYISTEGKHGNPPLLYKFKYAAD